MRTIKSRKPCEHKRWIVSSLDGLIICDKCARWANEAEFVKPQIEEALLTKLREGLAEIYTYTIEPNKGHELILRHQVEALLEKAGE